MYTEEQKRRALEAYDAIGRIGAVNRKLGYPNTKTLLQSLYG